MLLAIGRQGDLQNLPFAGGIRQARKADIRKLISESIRQSGGRWRTRTCPLLSRNRNGPVSEAIFVSHDRGRGRDADGA